MEQGEVIKNSDKLLGVMGDLKKEMGLDYAYCLLTDVLKVNSHCLGLEEDESLLKKAFPKLKKVKSGVYNLGPILSRKKEVSPLLEKAVKGS